MDISKHIKVFDTTLRDGQQCPGAGMSFDDNLRYAELAAEVGVDVLEAGFPSASKVDFKIVNQIAKTIGVNSNSPVIAGLCQLRSAQVDKTIEALQPAVKSGKAKMHVYLPVDPKLMEASLGKDLAHDHKKLAADVFEMVERAVKAGLQVEFSPEGYSRMAENFDFVTTVIEQAVRAGANVINCPDTIGGGCSYQGKDYFVEKMNQHAETIDKLVPDNQVTWSAHCHNDFGLAVANTINAVFQGPCRQIEGCFNGVGERAGNAALEQCIMIIKHFGENAAHDGEAYFTKINTEKIAAICNFISENMLPTQPHWPISGANAYKHSSGGHTNAVLKNPLAYQPFDPKEVGQDISLLFGPLSGGNHARSIIAEAGYLCREEEKAEIAQRIKDIYAERRKGITDEELIKAYFDLRKPIKAKNFHYSRNKNRSEFSFTGKFFDKKGEIKESYEGKESALAALKKAIDENYPGCSIKNYTSNSKGDGITATSVSKIILEESDGACYEGLGEDKDIEIAAMKALINAFNKAYVTKNYFNKNN